MRKSHRPLLCGHWSSLSGNNDMTQVINVSKSDSKHDTGGWKLEHRRQGTLCQFNKSTTDPIPDQHPLIIRWCPLYKQHKRVRHLHHPYNSCCLHLEPFLRGPLWMACCACLLEHFHCRDSYSLMVSFFHVSGRQRANCAASVGAVTASLWDATSTPWNSPTPSTSPRQGKSCRTARCSVTCSMSRSMSRNSGWSLTQISNTFAVVMPILTRCVAILVQWCAGF